MLESVMLQIQRVGQIRLDLRVGFPTGVVELGSLNSVGSLSWRELAESPQAFCLGFLRGCQ